MSKKPAKDRDNQPLDITAEEIVAKWAERVKSRLKPWRLDAEVTADLEPKLQDNIGGLLGDGAVFKRKDMKNSLKVANDVAKICKLLQPAPHSKVVRLDTFQQVLSLCATSHKVCQGPGGAGGWCDV